MSKNLLAAAAVAAVMAAAAPSFAGVIFVPPSDTVGTVFTTNFNDAYSGGRGVVFAPTSNFDLTSVGIYQDLTNITVNFALALATAPTGNVGGGTVLRSGSATVTTSGLEFVDFAFASITLNAGTS